jgi:hypothetical protein
MVVTDRREPFGARGGREKSQFFWMMSSGSVSRSTASPGLIQRCCKSAGNR